MDYIEEFLCYIDREYRFPMRVKLNRFKRKYAVLNQKYNLDECLVIICLVLLIFFLGLILDRLFG